MYANQQGEDWERYFRQFDRSSIDEAGKVTTYANSVEEMYQMFKARMISEMTIRAFGNDPLPKTQTRVSMK